MGWEERGGGKERKEEEGKGIRGKGNKEEGRGIRKKRERKEKGKKKEKKEEVCTVQGAPAFKK